MPGLFAGARLSLQAQPSGCAASDEDIGERPAINVVAGGAMISFCDIVAGMLIGGGQSIMARSVGVVGRKGILVWVYITLTAGHADYKPGTTLFSGFGTPFS